MGKKKSNTELLLPAITDDAEQKVECYDVFISSVSFFKNEVLSLSFERIFQDDDVVDEYGSIIRDDEVYERKWFEIPIIPFGDSLYSQVLKSAFYDEGMPTQNFNPKELMYRFIQIVLGDGRFLIGIRPHPGITEKMRNELAEARSYRLQS